MKKTTFLIIITFVVGYAAFAQQYNNYNLYNHNPYLYNPAATINNYRISAFLNSRTQWVGFDGAPETQTFGLSSKLTRNMGLGLNIYNHKHGVINNLSARGSYAFRANIGDSHFFQLGTSLGITNDRLSVPDVINADISDPNLNSDFYNLTSFSAGFGLLYNLKGLETQFIMPQFYERSNTNFYSIGIVGYNFNVNDTWRIKPSVMARGEQKTPFQLDGNLMAVWKETIWAQIGYRSNNSGIFSLGVNYKGIGLGYAYQVNSAPISTVSNGTHEIQIVANLGKPREKKSECVLNGYVKTESSKKPIKAEVKIIESGSQVADKKTNDEGYYTETLKPEKTYEVEATAEGYRPYKTVVTIGKDETEKDLDIFLQPENAIVHGSVTGDGDRLESEIKIFENGTEIATLTTEDYIGQYETILKNGKTYTFKTSADDFEKKVSTLTLKPTDEKVLYDIDLTLIIPIVTVKGDVTDEKTNEKIPAKILVYQDSTKIKLRFKK